MVSLPSLINTLSIKSKGKRQDNKHNRSSSDSSCQVLTPPPTPSLPPLSSSVSTPRSLPPDTTQAPQSTSNTPLPSLSSPPPVVTSSKKNTAPPPKSKKVPALTFDEVWKVWFERYEDPEEKGCITGEGVESFFEDMRVEMDGPLPFILAYKVNSKPGTFGSYYLQDFLTAFRTSKISTPADLKSHLLSSEKALFAATPGDSMIKFKQFYAYLFNFLKTEGQKSLSGEMATAVWGIVLARRFEIAKEFVEYTTSLGAGHKGVSQDVWNQLYEFCMTVDKDLVGFSEEDAWPAILDSFVEWKREKDAKK